MGPSRSQQRICAGLALATVLGLGGLVSSPVQAKEIDGILRFILTQTRQNGVRADGHTGTIDVRWNRRVTRDLSYLLSARYSTGESETLFGIDPLTTGTDEFEPRLQVRWVRPNFELSFGDRFRRTTTETEDLLSVRSENNVFARFNTSFQRAPQFLLDFNRRDIRLDDATADRVNGRLLAQLSYFRPTWGLSLGQRRSNDDNVGIRTRTVDETLFNASVNQMGFGNRVSFFANYTVNDLNSKEELAVDTLVPIERQLRAGLALRDLTPDESTLLPEPALIDGNRVAATQINIGGGLAGGEVNWNFGAELLDETQAVDLIDIWLSAAIPEENARVYRWQVWTSEDNQLWNLITVSAAFEYDRFEGRFRLRFPSVQARFVKVVNVTVDDSLGAVFVSEIELFGRELRSGESESGSTTQNASATLLWNPNNPLSVNIAGFFSEVSTDNEGVTTKNEDTRGNFTLTFEPSRTFLGSASALYTERTRAFTDDESEWSYALTLTALPHPDLELTTVANVRDRQRDNRIAEVRTLLFRISSLLYRDLSIAAEYGMAYEESFDAPTRTRETIRAILDARPREEIELNSLLLLEWIEFPFLPGGPLNRRNVNWDTRLNIRPSSVLNITIQGIYFELPEDTGWSRIFQIDWLPLPEGAIQFSVDFREEIPLGGLERRLRSVRLRWNLNRDMFLDLDATRQRIGTADGNSEARTLLSAFFQWQF